MFSYSYYFPSLILAANRVTGLPSSVDWHTHFPFSKWWLWVWSIVCRGLFISTTSTALARGQDFSEMVGLHDSLKTHPPHHPTVHPSGSSTIYLVILFSPWRLGRGSFYTGTSRNFSTYRHTAPDGLGSGNLGNRPLHWHGTQASKPSPTASWSVSCGLRKVVCSVFAEKAKHTINSHRRGAPLARPPLL